MNMRTNVNVYSDKGPVKFKGFYFSGGEPHVEIENPHVLQRAEVLIDARVGSMNDLGMLLALTDAVKRLRPARVSLFLPYFPGARQDREERGFALTAKIYADIINAQGYEEVFILDPHSPVSPALIERCLILPHASLVKQFAPVDLAGLICPDAGAERRTLELAKELRCTTVVFARKKRDPRTGSLSGFSLEPLPREGAYLLADDLCDGGGTFVGLAEKFREDPRGTGSLHLWTTHGIFSKGLDVLAKHFTTIGCSDSFPSLVLEQPHAQLKVSVLRGNLDDLIYALNGRS
jgi:ribose-phosphate pyrophosphokinase